MNREEFIKKLKQNNLYSEENIKKLDIYINELVIYNDHTNITSITNTDEIYLKHFYDSLTLAFSIDLSKVDNLLDIGTGAGFPGMVLAIFYPKINITLLDSNNKKIKFLEIIKEKLQLSNVTIINDRAEDYAKNNLNTFDIVTSRAVAFIDIITELSIPFIKQSGKVILMKGNIDNEIKILEKYKDELNINNYEIVSLAKEENYERNLIIIAKKQLTKHLLNYSQIKKRNSKWNK